MPRTNTKTTQTFILNSTHKKNTAAHDRCSRCQWEMVVARSRIISVWERLARIKVICLLPMREFSHNDSQNLLYTRRQTHRHTWDMIRSPRPSAHCQVLSFDVKKCGIISIVCVTRTFWAREKEYTYNRQTSQTNAIPFVVSSSRLRSDAAEDRERWSRLSSGYIILLSHCFVNKIHTYGVFGIGWRARAFAYCCCFTNFCVRVALFTRCLSIFCLVLLLFCKAMSLVPLNILYRKLSHQFSHRINVQIAPGSPNIERNARNYVWECLWVDLFYRNSFQ